MNEADGHHLDVVIPDMGKTVNPSLVAQCRRDREGESVGRLAGPSEAAFRR